MVPIIGLGASSLEASCLSWPRWGRFGLPWRRSLSKRIAKAISFDTRGVRPALRPPGYEDAQVVGSKARLGTRRKVIGGHVTHCRTGSNKPNVKPRGFGRRDESSSRSLRPIAARARNYARRPRRRTNVSLEKEYLLSIPSDAVSRRSYAVSRPVDAVAHWVRKPAKLRSGGPNRIGTPEISGRFRWE